MSVTQTYVTQNIILYVTQTIVYCVLERSDLNYIDKEGQECVMWRKFTSSSNTLFRVFLKPQNVKWLNFFSVDRSQT